MEINAEEVKLMSDPAKHSGHHLANAAISWADPTQMKVEMTHYELRIRASTANGQVASSNAFPVRGVTLLFSRIETNRP